MKWLGNAYQIVIFEGSQVQGFHSRLQMTCYKSKNTL